MDREISEELTKEAVASEGVALLDGQRPRKSFSLHVPRAVDHFALAFVLYFLV